MLSILRATLVAVAGLALVPALAHAHIVADPAEGPAGGYFRTAFRVTHGCKGSPTVALTIRMPDGVLSAKPMPKPGWTIEIKTRPLDKPVAGQHGFALRDAVTEVTWRGGRLENAQFDEFVVMVGLPARAGETLYFPVLQSCEKGENNWNGIPAAGQNWHDLPEPAPFITLKPAAGGHAH
jgi:uncharacterized protein YcnI